MVDRPHSQMNSNDYYFDEKIVKDFLNKFSPVGAYKRSVKVRGKIIQASKNILEQNLMTSITGIDVEDRNGIITSSNSISELTYRFREELNGKRYLIVLDDVWEEYHYESIRDLEHILDCGGKGSAIIVTTRSERVSKIMRTTARSYHLSYLSSDESWTLFSRIFDYGVPEELVDIGKAIVDKCGGLPLALGMVGRQLYLKSDRKEWLDIKESNILNFETDLLSALRLSYKHLPLFSKQCFNFCAIFPKDHRIKKDILIQMWMANSVNYEEYEPHDTFDILVGRSFFNDLKQEIDPFENESLPITTCRMHRIVHDFAESNSRGQCVKLWEKLPKVTMGKVHHLSILRLGTLDMKQIFQSFPDLRTLLICDKFAGQRMESMDVSQPTHLRVLQFHNMRNSLPISVKFLPHLRFLDLSCAQVSELPESICELINLQTLNLSGCLELRKLPERMGGMKSLRHLYLDGCPKIRHMPPCMGHLTNLRVLTMYAVGNEAWSGIGELKWLQLSVKLKLLNLNNVNDAAEAREVLDSKPELQWLELCWGDDNVDRKGNEDEVMQELKPPVYIRFLKIWQYYGTNLPTWMADSVHSLRYLVELHMGYCRELRHLALIWQLRALEVLSLTEMDKLKYIMCDDDAADYTRVQVFPSLRKLMLNDLKSLANWWEKENTVDYQSAMGNLFPALVHMEIVGCPKLASMPLLPLLEVLRLSWCDQIPLGSIIASNSLVDLEIISCDRDEGASTLDQEKDPKMTDFGSCLEQILLMDCDWIFSCRCSGLWRNMISLQRLTVRRCQTLRDLHEVLQGLNSLRCLTIYDCCNLTGESSSATVDAPPLTALRHLQIEECTELRSLPQALLKSLKTLESLKIEGCPKLDKKCKSGGEYWHLVSDIPSRFVGIAV